MMEGEIWFSLGLLALVAVLVIAPAFWRAPGLGLLLVFGVISLASWFRGQDLTDLGLGRPASWPAVIGWSLLLGTSISLASTLLLEPLTDWLTQSTHDHSVVDPIRGNWKSLLVWLAAVWLVVAPLEELIFRGFMTRELIWLLGVRPDLLFLNLLFSSTLFGLAHWYQGRSGALSTGIVGLLLGGILIWGELNLWLPILTHAVINTVAMILIFFNGDIKLKTWVQARFYF